MPYTKMEKKKKQSHHVFFGYKTLLLYHNYNYLLWPILDKNLSYNQNGWWINKTPMNPQSPSSQTLFVYVTVVKLATLFFSIKPFVITHMGFSFVFITVWLCCLLSLFHVAVARYHCGKRLVWSSKLFIHAYLSTTQLIDEKARLYESQEPNFLWVL